MVDFAFSSPIASLQAAIGKAFPDRAAIVNTPFDGTLEQAWAAFARFLAITPTEMAKDLAPFFGVAQAGALDQCTPEALALLPSYFCQQSTILPLRVDGKILVIATANPLDENVTVRTRFVANRPILWVLAPPEEIKDAIVYAYSKEASRSDLNGDSLSRTIQADIDDNATVKLGRALISSAIAQRASDLHIQPYMGAFVARIRVDGLLRRLTMLPDAAASSLLRHLKVRSDMDANNALIPQDGRMSMVVHDREFDMRVSSLPASRGERIVIRFLDQSRVHNLSSARFSHAALQTMRRGITRPSGMVIMTGPTGCGKTSTLYGMLAELNRSTVNIITVENPVEYRIPGVSQVEVNEKAGRTFTTALRAILRQDPDVVLIGEIRDAETAEIACQAALTGHLVLSTLHTNDALTAIPRLLNLGIQPNILADSLVMVIAQRLCRALCTQCRVPVSEPLDMQERAFAEITHNRPSYRAMGCKQCSHTGYFGRLPIVDIAEVNTTLRESIASGESRLAVFDKLRDGGLRSLAASGSLRIISGDTTVQEVLDTVGPSFWAELAQHYGAINFTSVPEPTQQHILSGQGVLAIAPEPQWCHSLADSMNAEGFQFFTVTNAEAAHTLLEKNEDITLILVDVPETATLDEAIEAFRNGRIHTSWTRLPTLLLLPPNLADFETQIRDSGVMAEFLVKPVTNTILFKHIHRARAR